LPNVVLEAMAGALPIVSTTLGGVAEAVEDGVGGLLVAPEDPVALAAALERVLTDSELAGRLGHGGDAQVRLSFDRERTLPHVFATLAEAGLVHGHQPIALERNGSTARRAA
jgi:glycosyltransferase involved in cell wall biosynthesis